MKKIYFLSAVCLLAILSGCGKTHQVQKFAIDTVKKMNANLRNEVEAVYPASAKADSLGFEIVKDSINVIQSNQEGVYVVSFGEGKELTIKDSDKGMEVLESKGAFKYPENDLKLAKQTGALSDTLSDVLNAERMAHFNNMRLHLIQTFKGPKFLKLARSSAHASGDFAFNYSATITYKVTNTLDVPISGSDYKLAYTISDLRFGMSSSQSKPGYDLAPGESKTYTLKCGYYNDISNVRIKHSGTKEELFEKHFIPTGDEYDKYLEYLKAKELKEAKKANKATKGKGKKRR